LSATDATDVLYGLFRVIKDDFNGSMFGGRLVGEKRQIRKCHIDVLHRFLSGDEMKSQQRVLFSLYDFRFIPIELSVLFTKIFWLPKTKTPNSIQEPIASGERLVLIILHAIGRNCRRHRNRRLGYPSRQTLSGSGLWLGHISSHSFQRMAEEWRRRNPRAQNTKRARALRKLLTNNLCGVDVNETACMVACFSLYLAFMDQFDDPRDIWALADELRQTGTEKVLPLLMVGGGNDDDVDMTTKPAIIVANFFGPELPELSQFDLTIGNPPWVGRNQSAESSARAMDFE